MNWDNIDLTAPQGWICPKCGRVYSPTTFMCFYCGGQTITSSTGTSKPYINYVHIESQTRGEDEL